MKFKTVLKYATDISVVITIWQGLIVPIYKNYFSEMGYEHYFRDNWIMLIGIFGLIICGLLRYNIYDKRLQKVEDEIQLSDKREMEDEMIHAVAFWVSALNHTTEERDRYIDKYFPRNRDRIRTYINSHQI